MGSLTPAQPDLPARQLLLTNSYSRAMLSRSAVLFEVGPQALAGDDRIVPIAETVGGAT